MCEFSIWKIKGLAVQGCPGIYNPGLGYMRGKKNPKKEEDEEEEEGKQTKKLCQWIPSDPCAAELQTCDGLLPLNYLKWFSYTERNLICHSIAAQVTNKKILPLARDQFKKKGYELCPQYFPLSLSKFTWLFRIGALYQRLHLFLCSFF